MPDGVFEVPEVPQGVPHVLVVRALGVENLIQCPYPPPHGVCRELERQVARQCAPPRGVFSPSVCLVAGSCPFAVWVVRALRLQ
jgi:hypothetical protein